MAIEKEVVIRMTVARPKDGAAFNDTARAAKATTEELDKTGKTGSKAMDAAATSASKTAANLGRAREQSTALRQELARTTMPAAAGDSGSKALDAAAASAKRMAAETQRSREGVTALARELGAAARQTAGIDRVSARLKAMGVEAGQAQSAAARLMKGLGDGAKVAEADVRRLAAALKATGGAAPGAVPGGVFGRLRAGLNSGTGIGSMVGALGGAGFGAAALSAGLRGFTEEYTSPAQPQVRANMSRGMRASMAYRHNLPLIGQGFQAYDAWATYEPEQQTTRWGNPRDIEQGETRGSMRGVEESQRRLERQRREQERIRQERQTRTEGQLQIAGLQREGSRSIDDADTESRGGFLSANERVADLNRQRRERSIAEQASREIESFGRGDVNNFGGALQQLQAEGQNRPQFGEAELFRIDRQRNRALSEQTAAQAQLATTTAGASPGSAGSQGQDLDQVAAAAQARGVAAATELRDLERQRLEVVRQGGVAEQARLQSIAQQARTLEQSYRQLAEAERNRNQSFAERFGSMNEMEQRRVSSIIQRGSTEQGRAQLSREEVTELRGTGIGEAAARQEQERRGNAAGAQALIQQAGGAQRVQAAERQQQQAAQIAVSFDNQVSLAVTVNAQEQATQIADRLVPTLTQLMNASVAQATQIIDQRLADAARAAAQAALSAPPVPIS